MIHYPQLRNQPTYKVAHYRKANKKEPVREWIKKLNQSEKSIVLEKIKTLEFRWPLGLPLVKKLNKSLWELRIKTNKRQLRIIFLVDKKRKILLLLHGFVKKDQKTPKRELETALKRLANYENRSS